MSAEAIGLRWLPPADNGGGDILRYIVEKRDATRRSWQKVGETKNLEITADKLVEGNQYFFRVFAENEYGVSEPVELPEPVTAKNQFGELFLCFATGGYVSVSRR